MNLFSSGEKEGIRGNDQCLYPILGEVSETCVKVTLGRGFNHNHCLSQFLCRVLSIRYGGLTVGIVRGHQEPNDNGGCRPRPPSTPPPLHRLQTPPHRSL